MATDPLHMQDEVIDYMGSKFSLVKTILIKAGYVYIPPANTQSVEHNFVKSNAHTEIIDMWENEAAVGTTILVTAAYHRGESRWTLRVVSIGGRDQEAVDLYKQLISRIQD